MFLVANINAWRVNGNSLRLPEFTQCPDYEGSTPSTVMSMISEWPSVHPFYPVSATTELVSEMKNCLSLFLSAVSDGFMIKMSWIYYAKVYGCLFSSRLFVCSMMRSGSCHVRI